MTDEGQGAGERTIQRTRPGALKNAVNLLRGRRASLERLRAELASVRADVEVREGNGAGTNPWLRGATEQLAVAEAAVRAGDPEVGWRSLLQARRLVVNSLDEASTEGQNELAARATAIRSEAEEKLDGWRLNAVRELLAPPDDADAGAAGVPAPETIYAAAEILDARHGNVHRRVALVRKQVLAFALVELVGVFGVLVLAAYWGSPFDAAPGSAALLVAVALFGLMGASAGRLVALVTASRPEKLPVLAINWWMAIGRTLMGAAAALALYAFLHSGLVAIGSVDTESQAFQALVLAVAFAAGFSERLLERAVAVVGGSGEGRTPSAEPSGGAPNPPAGTQGGTPDAPAGSRDGPPAGGRPS